MTKIGPDGTYPGGGKIRPDDQGGLNAAFAVLQEHRLVAMQFGTNVTWLGLPPSNALEFAALFRQRVIAAFGELDYDPSDLPIRVVANRETNIVESHMPEPLNTLVANPEAFLGWADHLEREARKLLN